MSARILIVEDEEKIALLLRDYFLRAGYRVELCHRGDEAEARVQRWQPQLLVLDLHLPGKDGLDICRALRRQGEEPAILMLTARVDELDRLLGLELGADDYVCKPFSPREVVARAGAILRRLRASAPAAQCIRLGLLELDSAARSVRVRGREIVVTPIEFGLLQAMVAQPRRVWSRAQLLERVRGTDFSGYERNIDGHIKNLRRKLREQLDDRDPIRSVYGVGYGLEHGALEEVAPAS